MSDQSKRMSQTIVLISLIMISFSCTRKRNNSIDEMRMQEQNRRVAGLQDKMDQLSGENAELQKQLGDVRTVDSEELKQLAGRNRELSTQIDALKAEIQYEKSKPNSSSSAETGALRATTLAVAQQHLDVLRAQRESTQKSEAALNENVKVYSGINEKLATLSYEALVALVNADEGAKLYTPAQIAEIKENADQVSVKRLDVGLVHKERYIAALDSTNHNASTKHVDYVNYWFDTTNTDLLPTRNPYYVAPDLSNLNYPAEEVIKVSSAKQKAKSDFKAALDLERQKIVDSSAEIDAAVELQAKVREKFAQYKQSKTELTAKIIGLAAEKKKLSEEEYAQHKVSLDEIDVKITETEKLIETLK